MVHFRSRGIGLEQCIQLMKNSRNGTIWFHGEREKNTKLFFYHYLIEAWKMLERASCREDNRYNTDVEIAIANIQLFGTTRQIELAQKFIEEIARNHSSSALELLNQLRRDLRKELKLEKSFVDMKFLRFSNSKLPN